MNDTTIIKFLTAIAWLGLVYGIAAIGWVVYLQAKFMAKYPSPTRIQRALFEPTLRGRVILIFLLSLAWLVARYWL